MRAFKEMSGAPTSRSDERGIASGARAPGRWSACSSRGSNDPPGQAGKPPTGPPGTGDRISEHREVCEMQSAETVLDVLRERGRRGLPLDELYRQMFNPQLYLVAYGRLYSNTGAVTPGPDAETADGMTLAKIGIVIDAVRHERYRFKPVKRTYIPKKNGKNNDVSVTYSPPRSSHLDLDLVDLRRALGDRTQAEAAELLGVTPNTWARWERGELQVHPARAQQLRRLGQLVNQYGEGPFWGLGIDGIRSVLDRLSVPDALLAHGLDSHGAHADQRGGPSPPISLYKKRQQRPSHCSGLPVSCGLAAHHIGIRRCLGLLAPKWDACRLEFRTRSC